MSFIKTRVVCWNLLAVMAFNACGRTQNKDSGGTQDSCRLFAQEFYDWYLPNSDVRAEKKNGMSALEFALKNKRSAFDPNLVRLLDEGNTQAKRDEEPFLDFDPVLNSQDPSDHYVVKKITLENGHCNADVYGEPPGRKGGKPDVVAELIFKDEHWVFTDFYYPNAEYPDSKSLLRMLRFLLKKASPPK